MNVIMNGKGEYARVSRSNGHTGNKYHLYWGELNQAELFRNNISNRDYGSVTEELKGGIFIPATVSRIVTLHKELSSNLSNVPEGAEWYYRKTYYKSDKFKNVLYLNDEWRMSNVTIEELKAHGVKINVNGTPA